MRLVAKFFLFLFVLASFAPVLQALPNQAATPIAATSTVEIVVIEAPGCIHCDYFRKTIGSNYATSKHSPHIPLVFMDVNHEAAESLLLDQPISIVPTIVVVDGRQEVGRITGIVGNQDFFRIIDAILARQ